jgi:hypothetical protein
MATVAEQTLWLPSTEAAHVQEAHTALAAQDPQRFLRLAPGREFQLLLVRQNAPLLLQHGIYEPALLAAYHASPMNSAHYRTAELRALFQLADRQRLRDTGEPLPHPGPYLVFRGVAGEGNLRRLRGFSWTASYDTAVGVCAAGRRRRPGGPRSLHDNRAGRRDLDLHECPGRTGISAVAPGGGPAQRLMRWERMP